METLEQSWGESVDNCRLSISVPDAKIQAGHPMEVTFVFKNDGPGEVSFPRTSQWFDYEYRLQSVGGQEIPLTRFGQQLSMPVGGGGALATIASGDERVSEVLISRLYDMSVAGLYTLEATKQLPKRRGDGFITVVSNTITLEFED